MNSAEMANRIRKMEEKLDFTMQFIKVIKQTRSLLMPDQVINEQMNLTDLWREMKAQDAMLVQASPEDIKTDEVATNDAV